MFRRTQPHPPTARRISHAAIVCFAVSAIAFAACGMGLFVNHMLTGSLAISGTAAVGLIYLAMGLMNLGLEVETKTVELNANSDAADRQDAWGPRPTEIESKNFVVPESPVAGAAAFAAKQEGQVSSTRDVALTSHD